MFHDARQSSPRRPGAVTPASWGGRGHWAGLRPGREGAALITALGMLLLFAALGTAYVRYMSLEQRETRSDLANLRTHHLARGGVYAAMGEVEAAVRLGLSPKPEYRFDASVYLQKSEGLNGYPQTIEVTLFDASGRDTLEEAFRAAGTKDDVVAAIIENTEFNTEALRKWKASRCYRIVSRAEVHLPGRLPMLSAVEAIVTLDEMGACEIRFWKETHRDAEIADVPGGEGDGTPPMNQETPEAVQTPAPAAGESQGPTGE